MALVLTVKSGETVHIGNAAITVEGRGKLKVRIVAPKETAIQRDKVRKRGAA